MPDSLLELEKRRSEVLAQISALGDFRRGSISATGGRCGTLNCHCHKPDDPGHGPQPSADLQTRRQNRYREFSQFGGSAQD